MYSQQACLCVVDALIGLGCDSMCSGRLGLEEVARFSLCNASFICSARQAESYMHNKVDMQDALAECLNAARHAQVHTMWAKDKAEVLKLPSAPRQQLGFH